MKKTFLVVVNNSISIGAGLATSRSGCSAFPCCSHWAGFTVQSN